MFGGAGRGPSGRFPVVEQTLSRPERFAGLAPWFAFHDDSLPVDRLT